MNDPKIPVTEDELHAYVDDELPAERRGDVEAWLASCARRQAGPRWPLRWTGFARRAR